MRKSMFFRVLALVGAALLLGGVGMAIIKSDIGIIGAVIALAAIAVLSIGMAAMLARGLLTDVAVRIQKQAEQKQKLSVVLENIREGIVALDKEGHIIFANSRAVDIFGGRGECVGESLTYLIGDEALCRAIDKAQGGAYTLEHSAGDKEYRVTVSKISQTETSSGISTIIVLADITKEKSIAKEKSDFFANASHELKTPITVMQGHSELLLAKGTLGESEAKQLERIHKECVRLSDLISDMLKLSNLERKEQELFDTDINLRTVCEEVMSELGGLVSEKTISVRTVGEGTLKIDRKKIYELVENLCTNAVKYNKEGGSIVLEITQSDDSVVLSVCDSGIGIPSEHIPRLCERFYRVDKSRSKRTGGTGLGLAIVKHICVLYGAELKIESKLDEGTRVQVRFPKERQI